MNPLVEYLKSLTPGKIMRLGGMLEIATGAELAEEMAVQILDWAEHGHALKVRSSGRRLTLRLADGDKRLAAQCGCQPSGERGCCEHAIAALIVFSGLLRNGTISHRPPRDPAYAAELLRQLNQAPTVDPSSALPLGVGRVSRTGANAAKKGRRDAVAIIADGSGYATVQSAFAMILRGGGKWSRIFSLQGALLEEDAPNVIEALKIVSRDFSLVVGTENGRVHLPDTDQLIEGMACMDVDWVGGEIVCTPGLKMADPSKASSTLSRQAKSIIVLTPDLVMADETHLVQVPNAEVWLLGGDERGMCWQMFGATLSGEQRTKLGFDPPRAGRNLRPLQTFRFKQELWRELCFSPPVVEEVTDPGDASIHFKVEGRSAMPIHQKAVPCIELGSREPGNDDSTAITPLPLGRKDSGRASTAYARLGVDVGGSYADVGFEFLILGLNRGLLFRRTMMQWQNDLDPDDNPLEVTELREESWLDEGWDEDWDEEQDERELPDQDSEGTVTRTIQERDEDGIPIASKTIRARIRDEYKQRVPYWRLFTVHGTLDGFRPAAEMSREMLRLWWAHLDALALGRDTDPAQMKMDLPHIPLILTRRATEVDCPFEPIDQPVLTPLDQGPDGGRGWSSCDHLIEAAMLAMRAATPLGPSALSLWKSRFDPAEWWPVKSTRLMEALPELLELAAMHNVRVTWDGQPVEQVELDVKLDAEEIVDRPDWFALRPEVACADFKLSDHEWIQLLTGGLVRDGRILLAAGATRERLKALDLVLGQRRGGRDDEVSEAAAPRLRMFDWLELRRLGVKVAIPDSVSRLIGRLMEPEKIDPAPVPAGLKATMRPYQERGYQWLAFLYMQRFGACLADDMGLGKTLQAIALLGGLHEGVVPAQGPDKRPHLVVLPPTLVFNWQAELRRFYPQLEVIEYRGGRQKAEFPPGAVVLTTYDQVRLRIDELEKADFECLIFDEAQAAKNWSSQRAKAVRRLRARFRLCLTGTPLENHIGEYYSIMELALPGLFGDRRAFLTITREDDDKAAMLLNRARAFVMRRTKNRILKELPPKVETEIILPCDPVQREMYTRTVAEVRTDIAEAYQLQNQAKAGIKALAALMRLRQICISPALLDPKHQDPSPKLAVLAEKLGELLEESQAALVFSQFTGALDELGKVLNAQSIPYQRLDGSTPKPKRRLLVEAFQDGSGPGVFLISLKTGGAGLNLTRASHVFHLDPWWNPAVEHQATDRAHRIGQTGTVFVHRLLMQHTIEESMMVLKQRKQAVYDRIMAHAAGLASRSSDNKAQPSRSALLTREDFEFLLNTEGD